jgi:hypothetical protein
LYPIANKITQRINSCFVWTHSEIPFASMKRTLSIRFSLGTKRNCYIARIESVVSLFVNISAAYLKQIMISVYKYKIYCWKLFFLFDKLRKQIRNYLRNDSNFLAD